MPLGHTLREHLFLKRVGDKETCQVRQRSLYEIFARSQRRISYEEYSVTNALKSLSEFIRHFSLLPLLALKNGKMHSVVPVFRIH